MKLYTVKEAARIVGVSTNTLYKYLDEDRIHAARGSAIQGRFRIPESALEEFLGVKLSQPEPIVEPAPLESELTDIQTHRLTGSLTSGITESPISPAYRDTGKPEYQETKLPIKIARTLLIFALLAVLLDLFIARTVTIPALLSRLFFLVIILLLAYQEGGYRRG